MRIHVRTRIATLALNAALPLVALAALAGLLALRTYNSAQASSYGHGDCWRGFTPASCPYNYSFGSAYTWDVARYWAPGGSSTYLEPAATGAMGAWSSAPGPQYFVNSGGGTYTTTLFIYEYPYYADPGGAITSPNILAVTYNRAYPSNTICQYLYNPCLEWYGTMFINNTNNQFSGFSASYRQGVIAHELGHVALLGHHPNPSALMYPVAGSLTGPTSLDIGSDPPCNEDPTGGSPSLVTIRCIYDW